MDLEKLEARARTTLILVGLIGLAFFAGGATLTALVLARAQQGEPKPDQLFSGLQAAAGPIALASAGLLILCGAWVLSPLVKVGFRRAIDARYRSEQLMGNLENQRQLLEAIRETASLSDAAKQIAYRAKDLDALRAAIRDDLEKGDFEAATMLVNEMEMRFGYGAEAEKLRDQIAATSKAAIETRIRETTDHVEALIKRFEWNDAFREASRLVKQFPNNDEARKLPARVEAARDAHKRNLLVQWKEAIGRDDMERSLDLLRQLDQYLTPSEAESYKESARDVFRKRLQQLQAQFEIHVHDKNWSESYRIARNICDEFPNSGVAAELRQRLPILQEKAQSTVGV